MKKLFLLLSSCIFFLSYSQVGINTTTPNGATVLDINSNTKGMLIPRLTETERDTNLADNDTMTVPPAGVVNTSLTAGTLIYNTTANRFEFWDGLVWRQLFVATSSQAGNDGVVKIDSGAGGAKPMLTLNASGNTYGANQLLVYATPLVFAAAPTTSWPETTVPFPGVTSNIYADGGTPANGSTMRWRENPVQGQVHLWRMITTVRPGSNSGGSVRATLVNPDSGFSVTSVQLVPNGSAGQGNNVTHYFYTIADPASLSTSPTKGYQVLMQSDLSCNVTVESFTRISLFKD